LENTHQFLYAESKASRHLKIANVAMQCSLDPRVNRAKIVAMIHAIKQAHPEVELILFGETILDWYSKRGESKEYHRSIAEPIPGKTTQLSLAAKSITSNWQRKPVSNTFQPRKRNTSSILHLSNQE
jgi:hypothetical protein